MVKVSSDYRRLTPEEIPTVAAECASAWQDPAIPLRQWVGVVRAEIQRYREGERQPHFDVLIRALKRISARAYRPMPSLLDVGASSGYYSEVISLGGVRVDYHGCDYSAAYKALAEELYPGIVFTVGDATSLPFPENSFDIVLSSANIMHIFDYEKAIAEVARVSRVHAIFHRTPVLSGTETQFWAKRAYDVPTMEIHFNEAELLGLFAKYGLTVISEEDIAVNQDNNSAYRTYLLFKGWR